MANHHFFAYLSRLRYISRWNMMRNATSENVQEHSHEVAVIAHGLATIARDVYGETVDPARITVLAVFHDATETITGDLTRPIKYFNPEIREAYAKVEQVAGERLLALLPFELREGYREILQPAESRELQLVKSADTLSAYIKCLAELKAGNQEFSRARRVIEAEIRARKDPVIDYFLKRFIRSYELPIDELN